VAVGAGVEVAAGVTGVAVGNGVGSVIGVTVAWGDGVGCGVTVTCAAMASCTRASIVASMSTSGLHASMTTLKMIAITATANWFGLERMRNALCAGKRTVILVGQRNDWSRASTIMADIRPVKDRLSDRFGYQLQ
jgi:hypothetical protein